MTDQDITDLLFVDDGPERADLALVFGYSEPAGSLQRARHAASLYREGYVPKILVSGGGGGVEGPVTEAELMLRVVSDSGVPRKAILVEDRSRTTFENVAYSISLLRDLGEIDPPKPCRGINHHHRAARERHSDDPRLADRKSTRLNSSHLKLSRMPSSA